MSRILAVGMAIVLISSFALGLEAPASIWATGEMGTKLVQLNTVTGAATVVGPTSYPGTAPLAFHPNGTLYTFTQVMTSDPAIPEQLAVLDAATGQTTLVGNPLAERTRIMPLIVAPDGTLYAAGLVGSSASKLLVINQNTGQAGEVGPFGVAGMMDFTFSSNGELYGATQNALYRINTSTGAATLVVSFAGDIVRSDGSRRIMGIHFAPDGTLYATDFVPAGLGNSALYTVDPLTGTGTRVGNTGIAQVHSAEMEPPSPSERISELILKVENYTLQLGIERSFIAKLETAAMALDQDLVLAACNALQDFKNEAGALMHKKLTHQQATQLQLDATWTETSLNCPK